MMREKLNWKSLIWILAGSTCYVLAVIVLVLSNGLITGGITGLALFFYNQLGVPVQVMVPIFNVAIFVLGVLVLGEKSAFTTITSTLYYPSILSAPQGIPAPANPTEDKLLVVIFSGLMIGTGIGAMLRVGASTGGMDIPPLVLNKKMGIPVSLSMNMPDVDVLLLQMAFSDGEGMLHGILLVLTYTTVLNRMLLMGNARMRVKIMSDKYLEINEAIPSEPDRGITLMKSQTGYLKKDGYMVLTVASNWELARLNQLIQNLDSKASIVINQVNEVRGRGFTLNKKYD